MVSLNIPGNIRERLESAALKRGLSLSAFVRAASLKEADEVLGDA